MFFPGPTKITSFLLNRSPRSCFSRWVAIWAEDELGLEDRPQKKNSRGYPQYTPPIELSDCLQQLPITQVTVNSYVSSLQWCISSSSVIDGMHLHANIVTHSLEHHQLLEDLLFHMYIAGGTLLHARALIVRSHHQSICSWNTLIKAYVKHGWRKEALHMLSHIYQANTQPELSTYVAMLSACTKMDNFDQGRLLHSCVVEDEEDLDNVVYTSLINMYGKCGDLASAYSVSECVTVRDIVVWNALISVYVQHGKGKEALSLLFQMQQEGMHPNRVTFITILTVCPSKELLAECQRIHTFIINSKCDTDTIIGTSLLNMYRKCGSACDARRVFDNLIIQDQVSWNAMIAVYIEHGFRTQALQLFDQMHEVAALTDIVTFISILDGCVEPTSIREVNRIHTRIVSKGLHTDVVVGTALMKMYGMCDSLEGAQKVFDNLSNRDLITWNAMLAVQAEHDEGKQTPLFFARMLLEGVLPCRASFASVFSAYVNKNLLAEGKRLHVHVVGSTLVSDIVLGNALVNMYGKCECLNDAHEVFWRLPERDLVSWNTLISVCAHLKHREKALQLFEQMRLEGLLPDRFTFVSILEACVTQAALVMGKLVHFCFLSSSFNSDIMVGTALVTMYGKCGSLKDAERAFDNMPKQNVVSWNAFIGTFAQYGEAKQAIHHFQRMRQKLRPDRVTFTIILNACSHAGLVDEGWNIFSSIKQVYGMLPTIDHYACMIDLLGRVGRLAEAEDLLRIVPCERNAVLYNTLLGACIQQRDVERGEHAASAAFNFDLKDPAPLVMLSNIYSAAARKGKPVGECVLGT